MVVQSQEIPRVRLPPTSTAFTLLLGLLVALPSFGIDMSLPALTSVGAALGVAPERAGLMMSLFMLGFAVAPLFYGPVSDRYGRKPVVVFACTLFAIAGIGCAFARSLPTLLVWRVVQGAGAGASMTITLAIVRDLFEGRAAATMLSRLFLVMGVAPVLAPTIGGEILRFTSWRGVFAVLAVYGLVVLAVGTLALRETLPPARRHRGGIADSLRTYGGLFRDRRYVGLILVAGLTMAALFTYVSGSSFVYQREFGLDEQQFGLLFGAGAVWLISGTQLNPVLLRRWSPAQILVTGTIAGTTAGAVLVVLAGAHIGGLAGIVAPLWAVLFAAGVALPNAPALALADYAASAGSAAALLGAVQFGVGAAVSPLVGLLGNDAVAMGAVIVTALLLAVAVLLLVVRPWQLAEPQAELA